MKISAVLSHDDIEKIITDHVRQNYTASDDQEARMEFSTPFSADGGRVLEVTVHLMDDEEALKYDQAKEEAAASKKPRKRGGDKSIGHALTDSTVAAELDN